MNVSELSVNEDGSDKLYGRHIHVRYVAGVPIEDLVDRSPFLNRAN